MNAPVSLIDALAAETAAVHQFIDLLQDEGLALAGRSSLAEMQSLTQRKHDAADALLALGEARDAALQHAGYVAGHPGGDAAAAQDTDVFTAWAELQSAATMAKALNERNGDMIHTHLRGAQAAQRAIRAVTGSDLYGADGRHPGGARR
ncbi:flagellar protein FlgN [Achromobacter sp. GG226]|uniref:flagella synthesis protein FlgN n=1 Tax=Verticiella alkaliphila TaxID=2779529 RepID=UPI001C0E0535|nr:flagellar protein FlgN [Verticiella sp. GG226]MBU4610509.1 flagellar protein FlgN [Verticiella sp. GG226]